MDAWLEDKTQAEGRIHFDPFSFSKFFSFPYTLALSAFDVSEEYWFIYSPV